MSKQIFITGVQRSGGSIIANIIKGCGAFSGGVDAHMENIMLKKLMDGYLASLLADPRGQSPLPEACQIYTPADFRQRVYQQLTSDWDGRSVWMYKSHRLLLTWKLWRNEFPDAKWVIVRRRTGDVVDSCLKTAYLNAYETNEEWITWIHAYEQRMVELILSGANCQVIYPERIVQGDYSKVFQLIQWLGLEWNDEVISQIEPLLWKTRKKYENYSS